MMWHIGLGTTASFAYPGPASFETLGLSFDPTSRSLRVRSGLQGRFPSVKKSPRTIIASTQASALYAPIWRASSVWAVPNGGHPDTELLNINLTQDNTEGTNHPKILLTELSLKATELDSSLAETLELRSAPLASLLLSDVARIDQASYNTVLNQLLYDTGKHAPTVVKAIADEAQAAQTRTPISSLYHSTPSLHSLHKHTTLTSRRGLSDLVLDNLPSLAAGIEEYDYILLAHKVRENPDFPVAPIWHAEYDSQRSWLDTALELREEVTGAFFAHEIFLKKVLQELNGSGVFPHPGMLRSLRVSAKAEAKKMIKAESELAMTGEAMRLLRCKVEHLIPQVATTKDCLKALRLIKLETLDAANVMELSDSAIVSLLIAETHLIMDDEDQIADFETDCICDIISEYSDDVDEHYWNDESVLQVICNESKRKIISDWIFSVEPSNIIHFELYIDDRNYCGPLEPDDDTEETIKKEIKAKVAEEGVYEFPKILFDRDADDNIVLPLDDGYLVERSEGFYTNLSGLTGISSVSSTSSSGNDRDQADIGDSASSKSGSGSSKGTSIGDEPTLNSNNVKAFDLKHKSDRHSSISKKNSVSHTVGNGAIIDGQITAPSFGPETCGSANEYHDKRVAMARGDGLNARRLNTLHMAWDMPHRAHGPQDPGMRPQLHGNFQHQTRWTRPSPDWDAPNAPVPRFAQRVETSGMLDKFNKDLDMATEKARGYMPDEVLDPNGKMTLCV